MADSTINLSSLNGSNGFVINGTGSGGLSGRSVSSAGDVNGDGIDDLIIGAPLAGSEGQSYAGESYVVFGSRSGFPASLELSNLDGSNGFVLNGINAFDQSGRSVSSAGDINGDGFDDLIVGAFFASPNNAGENASEAGESYVVFGQSSGFAASVELSELNGSNGFVLNGVAAGDQSGRSVSSAGDVNGDGFDDLIIGAINATPNGSRNAGESYVVFGKSSGFTPSFELSELNGSNGFVLSGIDTNDQSGSSVSSAGDVNGDGFDDLIIGASGAAPDGNFTAGESYVVFGKSSGFAPSLELSDLNGSNGFVLNGVASGDLSGGSVSSAGDVNGDGFDDLIVGASNASPDGSFGAGESYVVFGKSSGFTSSFELSSLDGSNGFVLSGIDQADQSGISVSSAGDVNGDGFSDIIVGASGGAPNGEIFAGESYVVFGKSSGFSARLELSELNGSNGFVLNGVQSYDQSGISVSSAGDVNGDGVDDLIIGAYLAGPNGNGGAGASYVVFGQAAPDTSAPDRPVVTGIAEDTGNPNDGITADNTLFFVGTAEANSTVEVFINSSSLGTTVADGAGNWRFDNTSTPLAQGNYQITATATDAANNTSSTSSAFHLEIGFGATAGGDFISGTDENDTIDGLAGDDTINGQAGDDTLIGGDGNDIINGGEGNDILKGNADDDFLSGAGGDDFLSGGIGSDVLDGGDGRDFLKGGRGDDLLIGGRGNDILRGGNGNDTFVGVATDAAEPGRGEYDLFVGGRGADTFVLGEDHKAFYVGNGNADGVLIQDFRLSEHDTIQLSGNSHDYSLRSFFGSTLIYSGRGRSADLVGVAAGVTLTNFSRGFTFVC